MKNFFKVIYYILIAFIVVVAVLIIVSSFQITGNYQVKIVLSGSMEPDIKTGSVVIIKPAQSYKTGDVITFGKDTKQDIPTTHRIIEMRVVDGEILFMTKGDANKSTDIAEVKESEIIGKIIFSLPFLGYLIDFAKKPIGTVVLIGIPAVIIVGDETRKIIREIQNMRHRKRTNQKEK